jgi:hypothetical protein
MVFKPSELVKKHGREGSREEERTESRREAQREGDTKRQLPVEMEGGSPRNEAAHPGFAAVEKKIGQRSGIRDPGAVLAAATRRASPAAKAANPRLKRVKG